MIRTFFTGLGRNPYKNFVAFFVDLKTPKEHFEINWPLQNAEEVWWKCTNTCKVGFFFILVTFLAHDTSEILPSSISFFFPFFFTKSKEVWNICGDKCQHSDCKLQCTLLYRKYCRYLVSNFFVVKPVFVKIKNISQHEAAASFEISQT